MKMQKYSIKNTVRKEINILAECTTLFMLYMQKPISRKHTKNWNLKRTQIL